MQAKNLYKFCYNLSYNWIQWVSIYSSPIEYIIIIMIKLSIKVHWLYQDLTVLKLIKSSPSYFVKVRTLSGRGRYQYWPFYDLVCVKWGFLTKIPIIMYRIWRVDLNIGTPKGKNLYAEIHLNLYAVYAAYRLYSAFFSIQLKYCTLAFLILFSRLITVLQLMVWNETVVVLVILKACGTEVKLPLIQ